MSEIYSDARTGIVRTPATIRHCHDLSLPKWE
jgi:hypothetical protein